MPGILIQAVNFAKAAIKHVKAGLPQTPPGELDRRRAICQSCDHFTNGKCGKCGCGILAKTSWALETCPMGLWEAPPVPKLTGQEIADLLKIPRLRVVCITLARRPDRWKWFTDHSLIEGVERFAGIDGKSIPTPKWWNAGRGAWGCHLSHEQVLRDAIADNKSSVLVLEDDALFERDFATRMRRFLPMVPSDWEQIYFGGQHLGRRRPQPVNREVQRGMKVNRAHAYIVRGAFLERLTQYLANMTAKQVSPHHVDHRMQMLHPKIKCYVPSKWIVGQRGGVSDIGKSFAENRFWR